MTSFDLLKALKVPYDKKFFNLPFYHYEQLCEEIGYLKVKRYVRELLVLNKNDEKLAEKSRILLFKLDDRFLFESKKKSTSDECECGFMTLGEDYESCPVCNKKFYDEKQCYYKNVDGSCSQDGEDCKSLSKQCDKL